MYARRSEAKAYIARLPTYATFNFFGGIMFKTAFVLAVSCLSMHAGTIIFTDFGPSQAYDQNSGWLVQDDTFPGSVGLGFTPSAGGTLSQIDIAVANFGGATLVDPLSISFETDAAGLPSGTILDSWSLSQSDVTGTAKIFSFASNSDPTIAAGTQYWIVLSTADPNGYVWLQNTQGYNGKAFNNGTGWVAQPELTGPVADVLIAGESASVPEPASVGLTAIALLGVWRLRKRAA
jgi:hypothetical protein